MFSIRKFVGYSATALGLGVIFTLALAPQVGVASEPSSALLRLAPPPRASVQGAAPTAGCTTATQALAAAKAHDVIEDAAEKTAAKTTTDKTAGQAEDKNEQAAIKVLRDAARKACEPPVTAQCAAARTALDAAKANDAGEDAAEKGNPDKTKDKDEDKAESTVIKPLKDAVRAACEPQKPAPSAACVAAKQALKTAKDQDKTEDQAEKGSNSTKDADKTEDKGERDHKRSLQQAVRTACGSSGDDH